MPSGALAAERCLAASLWVGAAVLLVRPDGSGALLLALAATPATVVAVIDGGRRAATLLVATLALCAWASAGGLVPQRWPWDDLEHALLALAFCVWIGAGWASTWRLAAIAVGITLACAVTWEVVEWLADVMAGTDFSPSAADTTADLLAGLLGATLGASFVISSTNVFYSGGMEIPQRPGAARRVLVVDDSPLMLSAARLGLGRGAGWDVASASSGLDGVELAASYRPDAILLDVVMPDLDGPGTLRALREQPSTRNTPVVFLTADHGARDRLVALGAAGVIGKPFQPAALAGELSEVLGWST